MRNRITGAVAMAAIMIMAGTMARAERLSIQGNQRGAGFSAVSIDQVLFGNGSRGGVAIVLDSTRGGHGRDTSGQWKRDSINHAIQDSIARAQHVRDSIDHARKDSLDRVNHLRDSANHARQDSIDRANHARDSVNHVRQDSLNRANHGRDSVIKGRLDSLIHARHDSVEHGRKIIRGRQDSLVHHLRDSVHARDSVRHARGDSTGHGTIGDRSAGGALIGKQAPAVGTPQLPDLAQNYPNPFSGTMTLIGFSLPTEQTATLTLYNATGQAVQTVASGTLSAGVHTVTVDATTLQPGIYYYTLTTDSGVMTKRMIKVH